MLVQSDRDHHSMTSPSSPTTIDDVHPESSPLLAGERVAFTGTLASMTHEAARQLVEEHGGTSTDHASRQTTMLVVGEEGWPLDPNGEPSRAFQHVTEWIAEGLPIQLVRESDWLHLLGLDERRDEVHRLYTPAMLNQLLGVSVANVRRWARLGLIRPVKRIARLPYFDFREVTSARRLVELLESGATRDGIERGLRELENRFPDIERPLAQLDLLTDEKRLLYRDDRSLVDPRNRQRHFDFDESAAESGPAIGDDEEPATLRFEAAREELELDRIDWSAADWFHQGCVLAEDGELPAAIEAFRTALLQAPYEPEVHLHLAEALYRNGAIEAALERYHVAVEHDHEYVEAWTQIGCLHEERGDLDSALEAYRVALEVHPEYPDAHLFLADALHAQGQTEEAIPHWRTYLCYDTRGPWAERARTQLERAGAAAEPDHHDGDSTCGDE